MYECMKAYKSVGTTIVEPISQIAEDKKNRLKNLCNFL